MRCERLFLSALALSCLIYAGFIAGASVAQPLSLILPTGNDALLRNDGPEFYQYTDRYFQGKRSRPWQAGQYGFVRNAKVVHNQIVFTRFHEGVDIKPVYRNRSGEPLDTVRAIDDGIVVHVNRVERHSNYGLYVVVEHWWSGSPFYSLYAHLNRVEVRPGQTVRQGDALGRLGYTGRGINRRRAHLHFEINMLINRSFQTWYDQNYRSPNHHGIFNGINMIGLDVAALYLALQEDSTLRIEDFLASQPVFFEVTVPNRGAPDLLWRYPWLSSSLRASAVYAHDVSRPEAWSISFTRSGLPVRIEPISYPVTEATLSVREPSPLPYSDLTEGRIVGRGDAFELSRTGRRYLDLITLTTNTLLRRVSW